MQQLGFQDPFLLYLAVQAKLQKPGCSVDLPAISTVAIERSSYESDSHCKRQGQTVSIGGSGVGGRGDRDERPSFGPISFILMHFSANILPNNNFLPETQGLAPSFWEILD